MTTENNGMRPVRVRLVDTETGESVEYDSEVLAGDEIFTTSGGVAIQTDVNCFQWRENNWSCDCNRELDFKRARNEPVDHDREVSCHGHVIDSWNPHGYTGRYLCDWIKRGDTVVYEESPCTAN